MSPRCATSRARDQLHHQSMDLSYTREHREGLQGDPGPSASNGAQSAGLIPPFFSFDTKKFVLGSLCKRGHDYEGTGQSLKRIAASGRRKGLASACLACEKERNRTWREDNPEQVKNQIRSWRERNPEKRRALNRAWREANPGRVKELKRESYYRNFKQAQERDRAWQAANPERKREMNRAWHEANPERARENNRAWREANPEQFRASQRRHWDHKKSAPALLSLTADQDRQRREDFGCACAYCGKSDPINRKKPPMDHFLPVSLGNALTLGNAVPACQHCNSSKGNSDPWEWYSSQLFFSQEKWERILAVLGKDDYRQMTLI